MLFAGSARKEASLRAGRRGVAGSAHAAGACRECLSLRDRNHTPSTTALLLVGADGYAPPLPAPVQNLRELLMQQVCSQKKGK